MTAAASKDLVEQQQDLVKFADNDNLKVELAEVLPPTVTVAAFVRGLKNAALQNQDILKADRASIYRACLKAAMDGLIPDGREAALVVFGRDATYMPMIGGLRKVAAEHGWALIAHCVYEQDAFDPDLERHTTGHKPPRLGTDRGEIIGAYAIAEHRDGRKIGPQVMDKKDIERVRNVSRAKGSGPWKDWYDRMAEKTVARRLFKEIPFDSKDRERIERLLGADLNGDEATQALYGRGAAAEDGLADPSSEAPQAEQEPTGDPVEEGDWEEAGDQPAEEPAEQPAVVPPPEEPARVELEAEVPFEGDEPPAPAEAAQQGFTATFNTEKSRYFGKTVQEVFEIGDIAYLQWAFARWKTGDIVDDLKLFGELHPEIKQTTEPK